MKFVYLGGTENDGEEMPALVVMFGERFILGQPVEITDKHAIKKLKENKYFKLWADDIEFEDIPPQPKRRGRPPKIVPQIEHQPDSEQEEAA